jgi:hypothetical protein
VRVAKARKKLVDDSAEFEGSGDCDAPVLRGQCPDDLAGTDLLAQFGVNAKVKNVAAPGEVGDAGHVSLMP